MRKEYFEMFLDVIKTATEPPHQLIHIDGNTIDATDSKRALRIILEDKPCEPGDYKIAKIGKDYQVMPADNPGRFPDITRVMSYGSRPTTVTIELSGIDKKGKPFRHDPQHIPANFLAIYGHLQRDRDVNALSWINYTFLSKILVTMAKLGDKITIEYGSPTHPVYITTTVGDDKIEYLIMPVALA